MVLFVFQFCLVCNFRKFINFGLGTVRSERVKHVNCYMPLFTCSSSNEEGIAGDEDRIP